MQETSEIQEGFLCPLCMKDFQNPQLLQNHFIDEHSSEDLSSKGQNAQGIFDKAKRKLLRKDSEFERNEEFQGSSFTRNVSFSYWEPQELGFTQDHTNKFRKARNLKVDDRMIFTNTILVRLEKILNILMGNGDFQISSSKKKVKEQSLVPWIADEEAKFCFLCTKSFTVTRRKHHCRLCGQIICGKCSDFLPLKTAAKYCEIDDTADFTPNADDEAINQKNALRVCNQCFGLLLQNYEMIKQKKMKEPLVELYERIKTLMADADELLPTFNKMAQSLSHGESKYSYKQVVVTRQKLLKIYETLGILGKKVLALNPPPPNNEDTVAITKIETSLRSSQKLHRSVHAYVTNYLTQNMFTLKAIPSEDEYLSLQKEQAMLIKRRAEREKLQQEKIMKERAKMHQEVLQREKKHQMSVTDIQQRQRSFDPETEAILQQIENVKVFIEQARQRKQYDEVLSLEKNLNELQSEYKRRTSR